MEKKLVIEPKNKNDFETVATTVRISKSMLYKVDQVARSTGYTRNEILIKFIEFSLENLVIN